MSSRKRVLFLHGLESGPSGLKVLALRDSIYDYDVFCPHMRHTFNIWSSFRIAAEALTVYRPDIVVASSYGTLHALLLMQFGFWRGKTILLACAADVAMPQRCFVPRHLKSQTLFMHGTQDRTCPLEPIRRMARGCTFQQYDDTHSLKSVAQGRDSLLARAIDSMLHRRHDREEEEDDVDRHSQSSMSIFCAQLRITAIVCQSLFFIVLRAVVKKYF